MIIHSILLLALISPIYSSASEDTLPSLEEYAQFYSQFTSENELKNILNATLGGITDLKIAAYTGSSAETLKDNIRSIIFKIELYQISLRSAPDSVYKNINKKQLATLLWIKCNLEQLAYIEEEEDLLQAIKTL